WLGAAGADDLEVETLDDFPPGTVDLADRTLHGFSLVQRRDRQWLDWRYRRCPSWDYSILAARDRRGDLRGLAVHRLGWLGRDVAPIVEWIVPADDKTAHLALSRAVALAARAARISLLET